MTIVTKVSVIVPAYNISAYIGDALESLERQSFKEFEAVIVDDGSTDNTAEIVESFCRRDSRFRLLQKQNGGLASARNYGIRHARGEYIALLDGDDRYEPDKLATHVTQLDRSPEIGVVYSASRAIRDDGKLTFMVLSGKPVKSDCLEALLCKNFICHGSNAVFRRSIFDEVGGFDETLRSGEDIDFWLRIAGTQSWKFYRLPQVLCCYRVCPSGLSFNVGEMQRNLAKVLEGAYQRSPQLVEPILPTAYAYMYRYLARLSLTAGDVESADNFINRAWASDSSIFYRDWRSLLTLISVKASPLAQLGIRQTLGAVKTNSR